MRIWEIIESDKVSNTGAVFDYLRGVSPTATEIRQTYNKIYKTSGRYVRNSYSVKAWAEICKLDPNIQLNEELMDMLDYLIQWCENSIRIGLK